MVTHSCPRTPIPDARRAHRPYIGHAGESVQGQTTFVDRGGYAAPGLKVVRDIRPPCFPIVPVRTVMAAK